MRCWLYGESPDIPGATLERVWANGADATQNGRILAERLRGTPRGKRGILVQDLGGGASPESRQWWLARDEAQARAILRDGRLDSALAETVAFMSRVWDAYRFHGGPTLDFLASNVEISPDRWYPGWPAGFHWPQVRAARGIDPEQDDRAATEAVGAWASEQNRRCIRAALIAPYREMIPNAASTVIVNIGACDWREPHHDVNGWLMHDAAPDGVSCPMLYLTGAERGEEKTIANVLAHNIAAFRRCARPLVPCLGDVGFSGNAARKGPDWREPWETLTRLMLSENPTDVVVWWADPPYGPRPSPDEMRFMGRVLKEAGGK